MEIVNKLMKLQDQKKAWFMEYESVTQDLMKSDADSAEKYITRRGEIATEIDKLTEEIKRICSTANDPKVLLDAVQAQGAFSNMPEEYHPLYEKGQEIRAIVSRVADLDREAQGRLEGMRDEAAEKIKENRSLPKIKKYLTDLSGPDQNQGGRIRGGKA